MSKKIELSERDLVSLKQRALINYKDKSVGTMSSDAFWSKCVLEATISMLNKKGIEIEFKYPDKSIKVDK